jgi:hypothetical protein
MGPGVKDCDVLEFVEHQYLVIHAGRELGCRVVAELQVCVGHVVEQQNAAAINFQSCIDTAGLCVFKASCPEERINPASCTCIEEFRKGIGATDEKTVALSRHLQAPDKHIPWQKQSWLRCGACREMRNRVTGGRRKQQLNDPARSVSWTVLDGEESIRPNEDPRFVKAGATECAPRRYM